MRLPQVPSDNKYRILIAENDDDLAQLVAQNLQKAGFATFIANDGAQALQDFTSIAPHLLLCDILMPCLTGHELVARVRAQSGIPILMMTNDNNDEAQIRGLKDGADDYLAKPFNPRVLTARVIANLRRVYHYHRAIVAHAPATPAPVSPAIAASIEQAQSALPKGFLRCGECPYIGPSWKFNALDKEKRPVIQCPSCGNRSITFSIG
ncbi:transcriptional regulatory protein WalR [Abditibacteriota bacterium]|nr:transcriptional regulatory protein WalR [Abditibacteriota bacterium]